MDSAYKQVIKSFTEGWSVAHRYLNARHVDIGGRVFVELELTRKGGLTPIPIAITNTRYNLPDGSGESGSTLLHKRQKPVGIQILPCFAGVHKGFAILEWISPSFC